MRRAESQPGKCNSVPHEKKWPDIASTRGTSCQLTAQGGEPPVRWSRLPEWRQNPIRDFNVGPVELHHCVQMYIRGRWCIYQTGWLPELHTYTQLVHSGTLVHNKPECVVAEAQQRGGVLHNTQAACTQRKCCKIESRAFFESNPHDKKGQKAWPTLLDLLVVEVNDCFAALFAERV